MENGTENNNDKHELSSLLLVPMEDAKMAQKSRGGKRFVALLLVSDTAAVAAAAMTLLMHCFSSTGGTPIASAFSTLMGTGRARKQGEWCDGFWWDACGDKLSCFMGGTHNYCVPNGQNNACCGYVWDDSAAGVDCLAGLDCDSRSSDANKDTVSTCHDLDEIYDHGSFAKKGSCNFNTGEPANSLIELKCCSSGGGRSQGDICSTQCD